MRTLKSVVIGMAILITLGMALLVYGLARPGWHPFAQPNGSVAGSDVPHTIFGDRLLSLPPGCSIADMTVTGQRLFVRTGPDGVCARIYVIGIDDGAILGTIRTAP